MHFSAFGRTDQIGRSSFLSQDLPSPDGRPHLLDDRRARGGGGEAREAVRPIGPAEPQLAN